MRYQRHVLLGLAFLVIAALRVWHLYGGRI
jgi:hypothetical protein